MNKAKSIGCSFSFIGVVVAVSFHRQIHHTFNLTKKRLKQKKVKVLSDTDGAILLRLFFFLIQKIAPFKKSLIFADSSSRCSRHPVDNDLLELGQLRRPLVQGRVTGRAFRSLVQLKNAVNLK